MITRMLAQKLPTVLGKRLQPIGTDPEKERWMWYASLHRPEFHIKAVRAARECVDRRLLAFYYESKVERRLLAELQLANTPVMGGPILYQCNRSWKGEQLD